MFPLSITQATRSKRILYYFGLPVSLALWLLPLGGIVLTSLRSANDLNRGNIWGWPTETSVVENYQSVFALSHMPTFILNSVLISGFAVLGALVMSSMAGFALAKYRLRGSTILLSIFIGGNFVPFQVLMIPVRDLMVALGLYDTHLGLIVFHAAFQTGFATLFMRNFMKQLPDSVIEAARLDGATEFQILGCIVSPLLRPAIGGLSVLLFTFVWNDYFWSLVLVNANSVRPVTAGLQTLQGMWVTSWHLVSAAAIVAAIPPAILFFVMQNQFIAGLTIGLTSEEIISAVAGGVLTIAHLPSF